MLLLNYFVNLSMRAMLIILFFFHTSKSNRHGRHKFSINSNLTALFFHHSIIIAKVDSDERSGTVLTTVCTVEKL